MYFHEDKELFKEFLNNKKIESGIDIDILEKDYYVCEFLHELAKKQDDLKAYFKGGTAVYKILNNEIRFSEGIDLTVRKDLDASNTSNQKRLEKSVFDFDITATILNNEKSIKKKDTVIAFYNYDTVSTTIKLSLQRQSEIQIEATSFTVSEPVKKYIVEHIIYKLANTHEREILKEKYNIAPFEIEIIALERIFVDKIFATEFYYTREEYASVAKHLFDIYYLMQNIDIQNILKDNQTLNILIRYKREEETRRIGGVSNELKLRDFRYFNLKDNSKIEEAFNLMQEKYVYNNKYIVNFKGVKESLVKLYEIIKEINI